MDSRWWWWWWWWWWYVASVVGRDRSVGITTRYGPDGPGIESRGGEILRTRPDGPWGPPSLLYNVYFVFPGGKSAGVWRWPPTPSSAEVKQRVELYLYSPSGPRWPVLVWTLPLPYFIIMLLLHVLFPDFWNSLCITVCFGVVV
jgi:hypothetical protein